MYSKVIILFLIVLFGATNVAQAKLCVLSYERELHPLNKLLFDIFENSKNTNLSVESKPSDLFNCIVTGAVEVLLVVHTSELSHNPNLADMIYFRRYSETAREKALMENEKELEKRRQILTEEMRLLKWSIDRGMPYINQSPPLSLARRERDQWHKIIRKKYKSLRQLKRDEKELDRIRHNSLEIYRYAKFLPKFFDELYNFMFKLNQRGELKLRKIRFAGCNSEAVMKRYSKFQEIIDHFDIEIEFAPKDYWFSFLKGKSVVNMIIPSWYEQSFRH